MAAITANDVTVSFVHKDYTRRARLNTVRLSFTMASLTYPANGVPLPAATKFGLPEGQVFHMAIMGNEAQGYTWKYDRTNHTLRCFVTGGFTPAGTVAAPVFTGSALGTHAHNLLVKGGAAGGIDEAIGVEGTDTLAKDAATDRTIAGADSATKGGVIAITGGTPAGTNSAPAFTGTARAATVMAELATGGTGPVCTTTSQLTCMVYGK
jgi:hypothetical protein